VKVNEITDAVIGSAIEVHRALGPGLLESAYVQCLCYELALINEDQTMKDARASISDNGVTAALLAFDSALHGPVANVTDDMKPMGDRGIVASQLQKIIAATQTVNNLSVVLLGSTGSSITTTLSNLSGAGGASLDQATSSAVAGAASALQRTP